jgi:hypothetical protein
MLEFPWTALQGRRGGASLAEPAGSEGKSTTSRSSPIDWIAPSSSTPGCWGSPCGRDRIEQSGLGTPIDLAYLELGGTTVELISYEDAAVEPAPQNEHLGYRMIALEVDDMQKATDYLKTKDVDIVWGPRLRETYARAEICDPSGNHIELRQWFRIP